MSSHIQIREFSLPADHGDTLRLWASMEKGLRVGRSDTPQEIDKKLRRVPIYFWWLK